MIRKWNNVKRTCVIIAIYYILESTARHSKVKSALISYATLQVW